MDDKKKHEGLPVPGYMPQDNDSLALVAKNKYDEEALLRRMDELANNPDVDKRWLAIARTDIEKGFMALNRSVFKPSRVKMPGE